MSNLRSLKLSRLILVILVGLVSLISILPQGYCEDEWVKVYSNEDYTSYYKPLSSKINRQEKIIETVEKHIFTENGKNYLLEKQHNIDKLK